MVITKHANERIRERTGINKKSILQMAEKALEKGILHKDTTGSLKRFLDYLYLTEKIANNMRIYNNNVFIFNNKTLITIIPLPQKYNKIIKKIIDKKHLEN